MASSGSQAPDKLSIPLSKALNDHHCLASFGQNKGMSEKFYL